MSEAGYTPSCKFDQTSTNTITRSAFHYAEHRTAAEAEHDESVTLPRVHATPHETHNRAGRCPRLPQHGATATSTAKPADDDRGSSCRGALVVAKQRIHVGIVHAGRTLTVEAADATWRIYDEDGLVAEVARTTTKPVARFKVHKPEPPRRLTTLV